MPSNDPLHSKDKAPLSAPELSTSEIELQRLEDANNMFSHNVKPLIQSIVENLAGREETLDEIISWVGCTSSEYSATATRLLMSLDMATCEAPELRLEIYNKLRLTAALGDPSSHPYRSQRIQERLSDFAPSEEQKNAAIIDNLTNGTWKQKAGAAQNFHETIVRSHSDKSGKALVDFFEPFLLPTLRIIGEVNASPVAPFEYQSAYTSCLVGLTSLITAKPKEGIHLLLAPFYNEMSLSSAMPGPLDMEKKGARAVLQLLSEDNPSPEIERFIAQSYCTVNNAGGITNNSLAANYLLEHGGESAVSAILEQLSNETDPRLRRLHIGALAVIPFPGVVQRLIAEAETSARTIEVIHEIAIHVSLSSADAPWCDGVERRAEELMLSDVSEFLEQVAQELPTDPDHDMLKGQLSLIGNVRAKLQREGL